MNNRDYEAYKLIQAQVARDRKSWLTRRRLLQASAAVTVGAITSAYTPKEVFADVGGKVTLYFAEGKRWGDTQRAVQPLFNKVYPNVEVVLLANQSLTFFRQ